MEISPKKLFLIDGLGALVTALSLSLLLANFQAFFGMPIAFLYPLAAVASVFALYSFSCFRLLKKNWGKFLLIIALANLTYCAVTLYLVISLFEQLTIWGVLYFIGEIVIVVGLAVVELRVATNKVQ